MHILAFALAPKGLGHYWKSHYLDQTFKGIYQLNGFDLCLLIPYFIVMVILAFYGIHRYQLVWLYYRNKKNTARWAEPVAKFPEDELPFVTIQLPIFNEQFVIERLIEACCRLDYPRDRFEIQLLDDSTDETTSVAREIVERYAAGFDGPNPMAPQPIFYLHRTNRYGYKAGALDAGLKVARGEFVAIFDADFVPPVNWVHQVIHHFAEPGVGMVQTRWTHLNRNYSFLTQVEAILLDGHFVLEHGGRSRAGVYFNFNGTAGMWRTRVIGEAGGWQHDTLTEDTDLSYRAQLIGWKFKYLQDVECPAELPIEMTAFKTQQARWAKGLIQTGKKILPRVLRSDAPFHIKLEAWYHLTANLSYPLMIVLSTLLMPAMIIRSYQGWIQMMLIDFPLFMASTMSVSSFYLVSQKELFPGRWYKTFLYLPCLMALGVGLTITNTKAVLEALFGVQSAFARTPKYSVQKKGEKSQAQKYRKRLGWVPWVELSIGCYFVVTVWYAVTSENYFTVPFLLLFVFGYWYTGLLSLLQGRFERSGRADAHEKPYPVGI
ncbi:Glycosyltransferase, catalytic subunit of cellulose synthase and poly-beta-1,6-N-acetylglucosamine synthase [Granulicella rosea]|uniref:Glycosyltransferase, catalytic subunit of cellulose synthase and poly-beta-1,6-N-acetylglucosamine synthase n=2 Tax=Granulicella rosea TaxID=474952 RepID=A0A239KM69_9BACT|nr:cellulose synthase family protein [Granulicella rosea]SNT18723.1 Glycosyltransferase, catalytic subunit of cellulose synthase and poly-beta-1,6-N-acetylglucosamine synthase [Granulicella rosea]